MVANFNNMKKLILFFITLYPIVIMAQPASGDGSSGNPYSGVITTPWTLSGVKYCGDLTVSSGTFTISAGSVLRFGTGNILTISGTGILSAVGNSSSAITFTSSGTSWGHLYFSTTASQNSEIKYCIIENGDVRALTDKFGGGIHIYSNKVVIENCDIRNNKAGYGAGIFQNKNTTTTIKNTIVRNNSASVGGGIYIWQNSVNTITNCLIYSNSASSGGGGFFIGELAGTVTVMNSTVVNNTSSTGANIYLERTNPFFINSIIWGSNSSIKYLTYSPKTSDFVNCAIQDPVSGSTTNCITLNAS